ncbi:nucleotidyltransferase domain-containing protein [Actinosynnema sp. NPDC020468]|uniref:nucleotidyltransferase domain-containing protein n=1 Tax=Actinosynnema sp. NPDC020468 TaxID=3154488 RepID=UPI0033F92FBE
MQRTVEQFVSLADRLLPRAVTGFYLVGSAALGAWRPGRSDIDFVAVLTHDPGSTRLRLLHGLGNLGAVGSALRTRDRAIPGTMNGVYLHQDDLRTPVTRLRPIASHSGRTFRRGEAFAVNPVDWKTFAEHGIAVRGPEPDTLGLNPEPDTLVAWNRENLERYWRPWGERAARGTLRHNPVWGILGPLRLHRTITTGEVVSKEDAGRHGLTTFPHRAPMINAAIADRLGDRTAPLPPLPAVGEFVLEVVDSLR